MSGYGSGLRPSLGANTGAGFHVRPYRSLIGYHRFMGMKPLTTDHTVSVESLNPRPYRSFQNSEWGALK